MLQAISSLDISRRQDGPVVVFEFGIDFYGAWPKVIIERARELHWRLINLRYRAGLFPDNLAIQGAILSRLPDDPMVRRLLKMGCPVVRLGARLDPMDADVPTVMHDLRAAGRMAADHFAERGFKQVGYVGRSPWGEHRALYDGFRERAAELGCTLHLLQHDCVNVPHEMQAKYIHRREPFLAWLRTIPKPLGLLAFADGEAALFCNICQDGGIAVPEEVAVLGYGNIPAACECSLPTLSSIEPDHATLSETAVLMLQRLMEGKPLAHATVSIPPVGVVVRESTDILAVPDLSVAAALRYVWSHLDLDLSVEDVAHQVGVSRRTLERGFRTHLGRGVAVERHRKRMEVLAQLLRATDEPIVDLAVKVGFHTLVHLHQSFRRAFGMTPRQYRLKWKKMES